MQAIENFALTVKEMAQMLQSFGTELAETELPDDIPSIEEILALRAERYHMLKVCLKASTNNHDPWPFFYGARAFHTDWWVGDPQGENGPDLLNVSGPLVTGAFS